MATKYSKQNGDTELLVNHERATLPQKNMSTSKISPHEAESFKTETKKLTWTCKAP